MSKVKQQMEQAMCMWGEVGGCLPEPISVGMREHMDRIVFVKPNTKSVIKEGGCGGGGWQSGKKLLPLQRDRP